MLRYKPVKIAQDLNTHPTGDPFGLQPLGGLKGYQDDLDTGKTDPLQNELGDDPAEAIAMPRHLLARELAKQDERRLAKTNDDLREHIEDADEHDE